MEELNRFKNQFVYANKSWYEFKNHRWNQLKFHDAMVSLVNNGVITECNDDTSLYAQRALSNDRFVDFLDTNPNLVGFENGVYDLKANILRSGTPQDYISKSTGVDFIEFNPHSQQTIEIMNYLSDLFGNHKIVQYVLKMLGSSLSGNALSLVHIWLGQDVVSKNNLIKLIESSIGDYTHIASPDLITGLRVSTKCMIDYSSYSMHSLFFKDLDHTKTLVGGPLKEMVDGDEAIFRLFFTVPGFSRVIQQCAKPILCYTKMPQLQLDDIGFFRRLRVVEVKSSDIEPRDNWKTTFVSMLLHYYQVYKKDGLKTTKSMLV